MPDSTTPSHRGPAQPGTAAGPAEIRPTPAEVHPIDGPELLRLLAKRWWLTIPLIVIGAAAGVYYAHKQPPKYAASQVMVVSGLAPNPVVLDVTSSSLDPTRLVQTQVDILNSQAVMNAIDRRVGKGQASLVVDSSSASNLITVEASASSAVRASEALHAALTKYDELQYQAQSQALGSVQAALRSELQTAKASLASATKPALQNLYQQRVSTLQTTQDELAVSSAAGDTTTQDVDGVYMTGPTASPSTKEAGAIGAALGLVVAAMIAVAIRSRAARRP